MSRYLRRELNSLSPYTPGEQPSDRKFIKLNTNESPFPPSDKAIAAASEAVGKLNLYPELDGGRLRKMIADEVGLSPEEIVVTNGSDEILNFCFKAFCSEEHSAAFADITYGFYKVFAEYNGVPYEIIPLKEDFSIFPADYFGICKTIFIANPNAPTGLILPVSDIEDIVRSNPDSVVVIDEAYIDFGGQSCVGLIRKYDNLMVTQTFSKSRSMAGARLGFGAASPALIDDILRLIYSTNPYNLSRLNIAAGIGAMSDREYTKNNCTEIIKTRDKTVVELKRLGFVVLDSNANFLFAKHKTVAGKLLYEKLRENGILVRRFDADRIKDYLRITIGSQEDMEKTIKMLNKILEDCNEEV